MSIVSKAEYLHEQKKFHAKQVTSDYQPMEAHKYQMFGKYDFKIAEENTSVHIKIDTPNDRNLLNYMRVRIVDKKHSSGDRTEAHKVTTINQMNLRNLQLKPNGDQGYSLIVEGSMPYNTTEGQLVIDTHSNQESFALTESVQCEPVEYSDAYHPFKYGIIFKEKVVISPVDHTSATMNIKLLKGGKEFENIEGMAPKYFRVEILDNGK